MLFRFTAHIANKSRVKGAISDIGHTRPELTYFQMSFFLMALTTASDLECTSSFL